MTASSPLVLADAAAPVMDGLGAFMAGPGQFLPLLLILALFYVMIWMPQQRRAKEHAARIAGIKRGDTVVLSSGLIGKVVRVEEAEVGLEIAQNTTVKVVKTMVAEVRSRGEPAPANDPKS
jgi:preprotein translocase subunit YajC